MYSQWQASHMAPVLTQAEREFRDRFVTEYLIDYSPVEACLRLGFAKEYANDYSHQYMLDGYVIKEIRRRELEENVPSADSDEGIKKRIKAALFREAHNQFSKPNARIAALKILTDIYGMNAPVKQEITATVTNNVRFYLPSNGRDGAASADEPVEDAVQVPPQDPQTIAAPEPAAEPLTPLGALMMLPAREDANDDA